MFTLILFAVALSLTGMFLVLWPCLLLAATVDREMRECSDSVLRRERGDVR